MENGLLSQCNMKKAPLRTKFNWLSWPFPADPKYDHNLDLDAEAQSQNSPADRATLSF